MTEINFYFIDTEKDRFLYSFLFKILDSSKKIVIYNNSIERINYLDEILWTWGETKFLPHGTKKDGNIDKHPIYLTTEKENPNKANFLIIEENLEDLDFLKSFEKVFYIFDNAKESIDKAKAVWLEFEKNKLSLTLISRTEDGEWKKSKEFEL